VTTRTFTNEFKQMGDDAVTRKAQKEFLRSAVQRQMFCAVTKVVLDQADAVLLVPSKGPSCVVTAAVWDKQADDVAEGCEAAGVTLEVYDGRELF
jgi:hypothetical protein